MIRLIPYITVLLALASTRIGAVTLEQWSDSRDQLLKDKSVVRYYDFEEVDDGIAQNKANPKMGSLRVPQKRKNALCFDPRAIGRWPLKRALRSSSEPVTGMRFFGTETGDFTTETWVCLQQSKKPKCGAILHLKPGYKGWRVIGRSTGGFDLYADNPTTKIVKMLGRDDPYAPSRITSRDQYTWHQIVVTWNDKSKKIALYVDGELIGEDTVPKGAGFPPNRHVDDPENDIFGLLIGGRFSPNYDFLEFKIDELVIYNRILTSDEIRRRFLKGQPEGDVEKQVKQVMKDLKEEEAISAIQLEISNDTFGYFPKNQEIPILIAGLDNTYDWRITPTTIRVETFDEKGNIIPNNTFDATVEKWRKSPEKRNVRFERCGLYWLVMTVADSNKHVIKKQTVSIATVRQLPDSPKVNELLSPLGAQDVMSTQPECRVLGVRTSRIVCRWNDIEPQNDEFSWMPLDRQIQETRRNGLDILICFTGVPAWDGNERNKSGFPNDHRQYRNILRLLVSRYSDQVKFWEIWDVPNAVRMPDGMKRHAEDYARLLRDANKVIRQVDGSAKVVGIGAAAADPRWVNTVAECNVLNVLDIVSFKYDKPPSTLYKQETSPIHILDQITRKYVENGRPLWNTGAGQLQPARLSLLPVDENALAKRYPKRMAPDDEPHVRIASQVMTSERRGAAWFIKDILLQMTDGVKKYFFNDGPTLYYPTHNNTDGSPSLKGIACASIASLLLTATSVERMRNLPKGAVGITILYDEGITNVLFTTEENPVEVILSARDGVKIVNGLDALGNPLSWDVDERNKVRIILNPDPMFVHIK